MVDSLPLRAVADEITGTLDAVAAAVDDVDLDGLLAPVTHFGETVGAAISGLGGDAVRNTIGQVWDAVTPPSTRPRPCSASYATPSTPSPGRWASSPRASARR